MELKVTLKDGAPLPHYAKPGDAGMDLTTRQTVTLAPGETKMVGTGVAVEIPQGYFGMVVPRSGLGSRGVNISNCCGIIDSGYRGEIKAALHNNQSIMGKSVTVERGERICQLIIVPFATCACEEVSELSDTERGESGFGSSGAM